ncbi:hypothetical protein AVEN_91094-1 [Araneus ventricosus]|uniref:Uncharacterized protein n=1 Tax=Araneus ventricosus TaxID=182803 RepID=A0A4Y2WSA0_ARAVE|nr:hypothetical protein AVEN_91094-1 [Araneus ventricosus]
MRRSQSKFALIKIQKTQDTHRKTARGVAKLKDEAMDCNGFYLLNINLCDQRKLNGSSRPHKSAPITKSSADKDTENTKIHTEEEDQLGVTNVMRSLAG